MKKRRKSNANCAVKTKLGRPIAENPRTQKLPVRFSQAELYQLRGAAAMESLSLTQLVRQRLGLPSTGYGDA